VWLSGYNLTSLKSLGILGALAATIATIWREYVVVSWSDMDFLLGFCWVLMAALSFWRVDAKRDLRLALVALAGGALIETWGTRSGLWTYFSHEQPPIFILPAWSAAALSTLRIEWLFDKILPQGHDKSYRKAYVVWIAIVAGMLFVWTKPGHLHPITWVAGFCIVATVLSGKHRRADLVRFLAGCLLGYPLELWGTTSECWVYWDQLTPPWTAVVAHGFASVAFTRGEALAHWVEQCIRLKKITFSSGSATTAEPALKELGTENSLQ
jgi:hypothetical protein